MQAKKTYKVGRRLGASVFDKCQTQKFALSEARHAKHSKSSRKKTTSDFARQLLEKQRVRFAYGLTEKQLRLYVEEAKRRSRLSGDAAAELIGRLEMRADNTVYRLGLASSRRAARQLVSHGHVMINGVRTTIPSHALREGDTIGFRARTKSLPIMDRLKKAAEDSASLPRWLSFDIKKFEGTVVACPNAEATEMPGSVSSILEFYSR